MNYHDQQGTPKDAMSRAAELIGRPTESPLMDVKVLTGNDRAALEMTPHSRENIPDWKPPAECVKSMHSMPPPA